MCVCVCVPGRVYRKSVDLRRGQEILRERERVWIKRE